MWRICKFGPQYSQIAMYTAFKTLLHVFKHEDHPGGSKHVAKINTKTWLCLQLWSRSYELTAFNIVILHVLSFAHIFKLYI